MSSSVLTSSRKAFLWAERNRLENLLSDLHEVNSRFPATREFLKTRGLHRVDELDRSGMKELREHLRNVYRLLVH